jgi:outer membrane protein TolC
MNKRILMLLLIAQLCSVTGGRATSYSVAGYLRQRFHPDVVHETDVEGIESHIVDGKLILRVDDFVALLLKNSTDIRLTQLDIYTARDAVTAAKAPFDPNLLLGFTAVRTEQPQASQIGGAGTLNSLVQNSQAGYSQVLGEGPLLTSSFNAVRSSNNSIFSSFNPSLFDSLNFQLTQPLLAGRGNLQLRAPLLIARTELVIVSAQSEARIADTISAASRQYWDAVGARDFVRVQQQSLDLAQKSYEHDKLALDLGAIAKLDIFQSESQVAQRKLALIQSQYSYKESLDGIRRLIGADLKPPTRYIPIELEDDPALQSPASILQAVEDGVSKALRDRPELNAANTRISIDDLNERVAQNSLLPRLDLSLQGGSSGLGGTQFASSGILGTSAIPLGSLGLGDSLSQIFGFRTPYYGFGLTLGIPFRGSAAKASLADALVNRTRDKYNVRQIQQQVILEVKIATNELELAKEAVNAALVARDLARQNVDAEQQKYEVGTITAFELLDAQTRLTQVESSLVGANIGYQKALISYERATWTLPYTIAALTN